MPRKAARTTERPRYSAPALEKGLDILELLAQQTKGLGQSEIARALGRTSGEIFRMVACLESREYIRRGPGDDRYRLTSKLFELAHQHPPTEQLLHTALPEMRKLSDHIEQSCHLAIRHGPRALVVAQVDSPGFLGFAVRVGSQVPLLEACSGIVLLAFQEAGRRTEWLRRDPGDTPELLAMLKAAEKRGYHQQSSSITQGITDIGAPILDHSGHAVASLTVPCLTKVRGRSTLDAARERLCDTATRISAALGGMQT